MSLSICLPAPSHSVCLSLSICLSTPSHSVYLSVSICLSTPSHSVCLSLYLSIFNFPLCMSLSIYVCLYLPTLFVSVRSVCLDGWGPIPLYLLVSRMTDLSGVMTHPPPLFSFPSPPFTRPNLAPPPQNIINMTQGLLSLRSKIR